MKNRIHQIVSTLLVFFIAAACNMKTDEQKIAEAQMQMQKEIASTIEERLSQFMTSHLENPDDYHPMQTLYAPLTTNNALYNPHIYMSARQLRKSIHEYEWYVAEWKKGGKDAAYYLEEAKRVYSDDIEPNVIIISDQADNIVKNKPQFSGLIIKHTCKVKSKNNEMQLKDYEFVMLPDKTLQLFGESRDVENVSLFLDSLVQGKIIINQANLPVE